MMTGLLLSLFVDKSVCRLTDVYESRWGNVTAELSNMKLIFSVVDWVAAVLTAFVTSLSTRETCVLHSSEQLPYTYGG